MKSINCARIDLDHFPRRGQFEHFRSMQHPFLDITCEVNVTDLLGKSREKGVSFNLCLIYAAGRAANSVPEFRQRIKDGGIVQYDFCPVSYTVPGRDGAYRYAEADVSLPFDGFISDAAAKQKEALESDSLTEHADPEAMLYFSALPWFSFTQVTLPRPDASFSIPMLTAGKYTRREDGVYLPLTVSVNHALVDGQHIAGFFDAFSRFAKE